MAGVPMGTHPFHFWSNLNNSEPLLLYQLAAIGSELIRIFADKIHGSAPLT